VVDDEKILGLVDERGEEMCRNVNVHNQLVLKQRSEGNAFLDKFENIFKDAPGTVDYEVHKIEPTDKMSTCDRLDT
jgi:hypothetical protein